MASSSNYPNFWQRAWDEAQPRLQQYSASTSGTLTTLSERINRVGQLDAEVLDSELVQLLQEPINKALSLVNTTFQTKLEPELLLLIRIILHKLSLWDLGTSYGAKLQDLRYVTPNTSPRRWIAKGGLPVRTLFGHAILTIATPYLHTRLRAHALSNGWPDAPRRDLRRRIWRLINRAESTYSLLSLLNFIVFLSNGRYRTIADRLLALRLTPSRPLTNRGVSYEFMNRQMTWHAFTEFLLLVLPLFSSRAFRRTYKQALARVKQSLLPKRSTLESTRRTHGAFYSLSPDQCAICAENAKYTFDTSSGEMFMGGATPAAEQVEHDLASGPPKYPITVPYRASCGDVYCYCCITERLVRSVDDGDNGWPCLRCGELVKDCSRLTAIADDGDDTSSRTSFSISDDDISSFDGDT